MSGTRSVRKGVESRALPDANTPALRSIAALRLTVNPLGHCKLTVEASLCAPDPLVLEFEH